MFKKILLCTLLFIIPQLSLGQEKDSSIINNETEQILLTGLREMLDQLKQGEKEKAGIWFKENYYQLHKYKLLTDSILISLAQTNDQNPILNNNLDNQLPAKDFTDIKLHNFIVSELQSIAIELGELPETVLPDDFIKDVEKYVVLFSENKKYQSFFQNVINKSRKYIPLLKSHFTEKGFPEEILFFIAIESGFDANAISKAGAAGMFQFMPATAREYGLKVNKNSDERFSAIKSAQASASYLKDLYLELGSINLALTSYNSGSGKTRAALKELNTLKERGFWAIRDKSKILAQETREYIPQIFASIVIAKTGNPEKFQFNDPEFPKENSYATFILPGDIEIQSLIDSLQITVELFLQYNSDIDSNALTTPKNIADYALFIPNEYSEQCLQYLIKKFGNKKFDGTEINATKIVKTDSRKSPKSKKKKNNENFDLKYIQEKEVFFKGAQFEYVVKRANTLHLVARIFNVSEKDIIKWNNLKFKSLKKDQKLLLEASQPITRYIYNVPKKTSYRKLALQFNVNANNLKKTNNIKGEFVNKGEIIEVYSFK